MRLGILLLIFVVVIIGVQLYLSEPLYVEYGGWSFSTPLSVSLGVLLLVMAVLGMAVRLLWLLLWLPMRIKNWRGERQQKKRDQLMIDALQQEAYHNWRGLLKTLEALAADNAAAAWQGAAVADKLGDKTKQKKFLEQAAGSSDTVIAAAAKAEICRASGRLMEAETILKTAGAPQGEIILAETYYKTGKSLANWNMVFLAATRLHDAVPLLWRGALDEAIGQRLATAGTASEAGDFWKSEVSSNDKKNPTLLAAYLSALARLGDEKTLKESITQAIKQHPQSNAIIEVVLTAGEKEQHEAAFRANETRANGKDPQVLRLLAGLAERLELPGKARRYYQMLYALDPTNPDYQKILSSLPNG